MREPRPIERAVRPARQRMRYMVGVLLARVALVPREIREEVVGVAKRRYAGDDSSVITGNGVESHKALCRYAVVVVGSEE